MKKWKGSKQDCDYRSLSVLGRGIDDLRHDCSHPKISIFASVKNMSCSCLLFSCEELLLHCLRCFFHRVPILDEWVKRAYKPCDICFPSLWWLRKQAESNPRSVRIKMRVEYLWFNDICLRNITMLRIPCKTRLRAFVRKFSPFRAPPHEVVIRGISQDYFGRQMNASLSPSSTLRLEIAVTDLANQRERERWNILETLSSLLFHLPWPLIFAVCGVVWNYEFLAV